MCNNIYNMLLCRHQGALGYQPVSYLAQLCSILPMVLIHLTLTSDAHSVICLKQQWVEHYSGVRHPNVPATSFYGHTRAHTSMHPHTLSAALLFCLPASMCFKPVLAHKNNNSNFSHDSVCVRDREREHSVHGGWYRGQATERVKADSLHTST